MSPALQGKEADECVRVVSSTGLLVSLEADL